MGDRGAAGPADREFCLVRDRAMGAFPARTQGPGHLSHPEAPVDPREDDAADQEKEKDTWQEVLHVVRGSRAAVI
jgi:hypothetical protein